MERLKDHPSWIIAAWGEAPHCLSTISAPTSATLQSKQNKESRTNTAPLPADFYPGPLRAPSRAKYHPCPLPIQLGGTGSMVPINPVAGTSQKAFVPPAFPSQSPFCPLICAGCLQGPPNLLCDISQRNPGKQKKSTKNVAC